MASTDATSIPIKNQAFRVTFPIFDADGDLVTGAAGLDSEVSKDGGTFADLTAEATEIATSSGMYYLDLTATEMNADTVAVIVKTSTTGAKTTPMIFYPQEAGDIKVNVTYWNGTAVAAPNTAGIPKVDTTLVEGTDATNQLDTAIATGVANLATAHGAGDWTSDTTDLAAAVLDVATSAHNTAGTVGKAILDAATATTLTEANIAVAVVDQALSGHTTSGTVGAALGIAALLPSAATISAGVVDQTLTGHATAGTVGAVLTNSTDKTGYSLSTAGIDALFVRALVESYAADGAAPTVAQALLLIQQVLTDFSIAGTTNTIRKLNGSTTAATLTYNDATTPTSATRAT